MIDRLDIRKQTACWLLVLWGLITLNSIVFRHAHRLADGRIVIHAHPYKLTGKPGPIPYNPHTTAELAWLDLCTNASFVGIDPLTVVFNTPTQTVYYPVYEQVSLQPGRQAQVVSLRGPPAQVG